MELINKIYKGDCLKIMQNIPKESIDMILCDLPFGVTKNKWDSIINLEALWKLYEKIIKERGIIILHGQDKFSAKLMLSNVKLHKYNLIWQKTTATGFLNAKKLPVYNPQKTTGHKRKISTKKTTNYGTYKNTTYDSTERYPKSILTFPTDKQKSALHPTQKPVALLEYLIKTYTNEGALILDNCAGSGSTGVACKNLNRNYLLIEKEDKYYDIIVERLK